MNWTDTYARHRLIQGYTDDYYYYYYYSDSYYSERTLGTVALYFEGVSCGLLGTKQACTLIYVNCSEARNAFA